MSVRRYKITNLSASKVSFPDVVGEAIRTGVYDRVTAKRRFYLAPSGSEGDSITVNESDRLISSILQGELSKLIANDTVSVTLVVGEEDLNLTDESTADYDIDLELGANFHVILSEATTVTISNTPDTAGKMIGFTLIVQQDAGGNAYAVTWPGSVVWNGGSAPTLDTDADAIDILTFFTIDGGTTWYGLHSGTNFA
jgi:hypothetical protein